MRRQFDEENLFYLGKSWKDFRSDYKNTSTASFRQSVLCRYCTYIILIGGILYLFSGKSGWAVFHHEKPELPDFSTNIQKKTPSKPLKIIKKNDIPNLWEEKTLLNLRDNEFDIDVDHTKFHVRTTLNDRLQNFILNALDVSNSRYIGIVVMEPCTGKILSMVSFDKTNPDHNSCVNNQFPAASVFKIITAAAAIEQCGFNSDSTLAYSGQKYTLYKSQVSNQTRRKSNLISFLDSFAQSVNPVFGKIGAQLLEKDMIEDYAQAFGFNRNINFEIPFSPSFVSVSEEPYQRAEIASGFNRETTISPVHGALMASAIVNQGKLVEPVIVDEITNENGKTLYRSEVTLLNQAITPKASKVIGNLMQGTIQSGTCKRFFKNSDKDDILSKLVIGGKTGTINSRDYDARFDWFVGFASEKEGGRQIALSVAIAHEKFIGVRSGQYARMIIEEYFKDSTNSD